MAGLLVTLAGAGFIAGCGTWVATATGGAEAAGTVACIVATAALGAATGDVAAGAGVGAEAFVCAGATAALGAGAGGCVLGAGARGGVAACATTELFFKPRRSRSMGSKYTNAPAAAITRIPASNNFVLFTFFPSLTKPTVQSTLAAFN